MKLYQLSILLLFVLFFAACTTVDVERKKIGERTGQSEKSQSIRAVEVTTEERRQAEEQRMREHIVVVKEPVVIPVEAKEARKLSSQQVASESMKSGLVTPENFTGGSIMYDYNENRQFPVVAKVLGLTVIQLEDGEVPLGTPYLSDTIRWEMAGSVWSTERGKNIQIIMIKPLEVNLNTNLIVITNRRIYQFVLTSTRDTYMPMIKFRYPYEYGWQAGGKSAAGSGEEHNGRNGEGEFVAYNYRISAFIKPEWMPLEAWDDGHKTYIRLPRMVLQQDYPVVFEKKNFIVNYRVIDEVMELDKLVKDVTLRLGNRKVRVYKKRGQPEDIRRYQKQETVEIIRTPQAARFQIEGNAAWMPKDVIENGNETTIIFDNSVDFSRGTLLIIDEHNGAVAYSLQGAMLHLPRVIGKEIRMGFQGEYVTIRRAR